MPHKRKKLFTKKNSTKYLLAHGNSEAVNADGETLESVLIPVPKNYKSGTSLLLSNLLNVCPLQSDVCEDKENDLKEILDSFDQDSDEDGDRNRNLVSKMKLLKIDNYPKKFKEVNSDADDSPSEDEQNSVDLFYDIESDQFSDASDDVVDSKFPTYSLTSSKEDCPETIKILNERFEKVILDEYDDDQIGALDDEEICGYLTAESERVQNLIDESVNKEEEAVEIGTCDETIKQKILLYLDKDDYEENVVEVVTEKPLEFDCESILSTYSNIYYHPTVIKEESSKVKKIRIPENPLKKRLTKSGLKQLDDEMNSDKESDIVSIATTINVRHKGETPEQRRERKALFKEAKQESRRLKKENRLAFKREDLAQKARAINARRNMGFRLV